MKRVVILGAGSWAKLLRYYIERMTDWDIVAYTDDQKSLSSDVHEGLPLVPFELVEKSFSPKDHEMIMGIGYRRMNTIREQKYLEAKTKGYAFPNLVHPSAILNEGILGESNFIMENVVIEPFTTLGSNNVMMSTTMIAHDNVIGSHNFFSLGVCVAGDVRIGSNCFLGIHSTVRNGIVIDDHTLVGAGAYVSKSTQSYSIITPARSEVRQNQKSIDVI